MKQVLARWTKRWRRGDPRDARVWAATEQNDPVACVQALEEGGSPNACGEGNVPALVRAVQGNCTSVVAVLLAHPKLRVDLPDGTGQTALLVAAGRNQDETVKRLIDAGAALDHRDHRGQTALFLAASGGCEETVRLLVNSGADLTLRCAWGHTAEEEAALGGIGVDSHPEIAALLHAAQRQREAIQEPKGSVQGHRPRARRRA